MSVAESIHIVCGGEAPRETSIARIQKLISGGIEFEGEN